MMGPSTACSTLTDRLEQDQPKSEGQTLIDGNSKKDCAQVEIATGPAFQDDPPDGGLRAWSVALGAYLTLFSTFGVVNAYDYYETTLLPSSSSSSISFIGSLQTFLLYALSPVIGRIFDAYGTDILMPLGSIITMLSMMMTSLCQKDKPYQFFLSQGVLFGIGNALVFTPAIGVLPHWFKRRRAYAIGVSASGASLGGVIYPLILQRLIPTIGFPWAVRVAAFITLACLSVACATVRVRAPLKRSMSLRNAVDFTGFKSLTYSLIGLAAFLNFYALFIPYYYIEIYADYRGVSPDLSKYVLVILNAAGIPARILPGILADRVGSLNVLAPCAFIAGILNLSLWLPSRGPVPITLFGALYGFFSGPCVSLVPTYIASVSPVERYGARLGAIFLIVAVATLVGTPTAGGFLSVTDGKHFNGLIIFTGVLVLAAACVFTTVRFLHTGRRLVARA